MSHALLHDATQLYKANCAQGNKLANVIVIYTLGCNLRKTFVNETDVSRIIVPKLDNRVIDSLNLTKRKVLSVRLEREKQ